MKKLLLWFSLLSSALAFGQGYVVPPQVALKTVNGLTSPISNAIITVCSANTSGIPCSPPLVNAVFKDAALTQPLTNPFTADAQGNYNFAVANGNYTVTVSASGFAGYSYQLSVGVSVFNTTIIANNGIDATGGNFGDGAGGNTALRVDPQPATNGVDNGHSSSLVEFRATDNSGTPQWIFMFLDTVPSTGHTGQIRFVTGNYGVYGVDTDGVLSTDGLPLNTLNSAPFNAAAPGSLITCTDCDTPSSEGATCTNSGDHAKAEAIFIRGAWKCF